MLGTRRSPLQSRRQAPRNSRELAVRNQFFTPRYVVEFLVDNTLGRTWLQMRGDASALSQRCRYRRLTLKATMFCRLPLTR